MPIGERLPRLTDLARQGSVSGIRSKLGLPLATEEVVVAVALPRPIVLIVDDDAALRDSLIRVLDEIEIEAIGTESGLEALRILSHRPIDALVCEQFLPGMAGTRLLELAFERYPEVSRVLFTAHGSSDVLLAAINHGRAHRVLLKNMHAVGIREEIHAVALNAFEKRLSAR